MEWIADPTIWVGLVTLVVIEIVLGIDNLVFIAILADKLAPHERDRARLIGLSLALLMRLGLLASMSWLVTLTQPLVSFLDFSFSGRDMIMLLGGLFLLTKATLELHERLDPPSEKKIGGKVHATFGLIVAQIVVLDAVFSIDSVITAIGMVQHLPVMMIAVIIAMIVMIVASKPLTTFVNAHPTVVVLCLGFLMMIGFSLVAEGFGFEIPKGYLYAAIGFSILIETFNQLVVRSRTRHEETVPLRQRTAEAVFRLLGGREEERASNPSGEVIAGEQEAFGEEERNMVSGALMLGERQAYSIMTPRTDIVWVSLADSKEKVLETLRTSPHGLYPICQTNPDDFIGYARGKDLMENMLTRGSIDVARSVREAIVVPETLGVLRLMEMFRRQRTPFAFVTDEYGGVEGLVTPVDMLEAIVGDFPDDDGDGWLVRLDEGHWKVEGSADMRRLAFVLGRDLTTQDESYSTLAGYVVWHLGRLAELGDKVEQDGMSFTVTGMERRRITEVEIKVLPEDTGE